MTTEEKQAITIDTLTKRLRSAIDSAQDHQRNCIQKEIQLIEAKRIIGSLLTGWDKGGDEWYEAIQAAKDYLAK